MVLPNPAGDLIEIIESRWTLQILLSLKEGEHRFADLKSAIPGIANNILIKRIRFLESAGLVERRYLPPPSARHVYALAPLATGLRPALDALANWQNEIRDASFPSAVPTDHPSIGVE